MTPRQKASELTRYKLQKGRYLVKKGEVWYLETCVGNLQHRRSLHTSDFNKAMELQLGLPTAEHDLPRPEAPKKPSPAPSAPTLGKALEEYEVWYGKTKRESGVRRTLPIVRLFVGQLGEDFDARAVTREHVQKFVDRRQGCAALTVRNDFARVRAFLRWVAARKEGVPWNAARGVEIPKDDETTAEAPSVEKVRAVLRKLRAHPWVGDFAAVLSETGMRPAELLGCRAKDLRGRLLDVVPWESRLLKSKWSRRTLELNETAHGILKARVERLFEKERPIFATELGTVYQANSALHVFRKALRNEAGEVPAELDMTLYDFRHFFCSEHAAPGPSHMELESLAAYIGHSPKSRETLLRWYTDQRALRRGAPPALLGGKDGQVVEMNG